MKAIIAGPRYVTEMLWVAAAVTVAETVHDIVITEVVSGHAAGVDTLGEQYAKAHDLPLTIFRADWATFGRRAGFLRNAHMAEYAEALVAVWDGESRGTKNMIEIATARNLKVYVHRMR